MKIYLIPLLLAGILIHHTGCTQPGVHTGEAVAYVKPLAAAEPEPPLPATAITDPGPGAPDSGKVYHFGADMLLKVREKEILITDSKGAVIARNNHIIRIKDENGDCPSEGFTGITVKDSYFTVEQQTCGGWYFIDEYITFRYTGKGGRFLLHKLGMMYTDRRDPDKEIPQKIFTQKNFGNQDFKTVNIDSLAVKVLSGG